MAKPKLSELLTAYLIRQGFTAKDFMSLWNSKHPGYRVSTTTINNRRNGTLPKPKHFAKLCHWLGIKDEVKQWEVENDVECK